jgi:hypothetical protein
MIVRSTPETYDLGHIRKTMRACAVACPAIAFAASRTQILGLAMTRPLKAALIAALIVAVAQVPGPLAGALKSGDDGMAKEHKMGKQDTDKHSPTLNENLVVTPAGLVQKKNVHQVGPNQAVRRNQDGTYTIVPKTGSP